MGAHFGRALGRGVGAKFVLTMEQTFWALTHTETGNILYESISETKAECIDAACALLNCTVQELKGKGYEVEQLTLVKKGSK